VTLLSALILVACEPSVSSDAPTDTGADDSGDRSAFHAVLVTSDFASGTVNVVRDDGTLEADLVAVGGDTVVSTDGATTWLLHRGGENTVQVFEGVGFTAPATEFSTGDGSNPQAAARCGDRLFVSMLADGIGAWDPVTGLPIGSVALDAFIDADGSAEPVSLAVGANGYLYAALQRLADFRVVRSGTLVKIDCDALEVVEAWDVGPNPLFTQTPGADRLYLSGGDYFDLTDGGAWSFDMASDTLSEPILTDAAVGGNVGNLAVAANGHGIYTVDDAQRWKIWCIDTSDGTTRLASEPNAYVSDAKVDPTGTVWVLQQPNYAGEPGQVGTVRVDPAACAVSEPLVTALNPYAIGFVEGGR
jgi:hypothetical protein